MDWRRVTLTSQMTEAARIVSEAEVVIDFGGDTVITCMGALRHGLSAGATITLSLHAASSDTLATVR